MLRYLRNTCEYAFLCCRKKSNLCLKWFFVCVAMLMSPCILFEGCGNDDYVHFDENRSDGILVAIVDDSLMILRSVRGRYECHEIFMGSDVCKSKGVNDGLFLVNYREKRTPLWGDTLDENINIVSGFVGDSLVFFYGEKDRFGFWKIGGDAVSNKKMKWSDGCDGEFGIQKARLWKNGRILLMGVHNCRYAILDTATGIVEKLEFNGEFAWLEGCDDIAYLNGKVVCLSACLFAKDRYGIYKAEDGELKDSLIWKGAFWLANTTDAIAVNGNMLVINHPSNSPFLQGKIIHSLDPLGTFEDPIRIEYNSFIDSEGNSVYYTSEDLVVTK